MTTSTTASERLTLALDDLVARGQTWPCSGDDAWTSEDHDDRVEAARRCSGCPAITPCAEAADEAGHKWGVWAGVDRGQRPQPKKKETAA